MDTAGAAPLRGPVVHDLEPWVPDLKIPRMHPCQAGGIGPGAAECGATPASRWKRVCGNKHERDCWLCGTHAQMITAGAGACSDCLTRGVSAHVRLIPVDLLLLGHAGEGG